MVSGRQALTGAGFKDRHEPIAGIAGPTPLVSVGLPAATAATAAATMFFQNLRVDARG